MAADIYSFARRLLAASQKGIIEWKRTERDPSAFIASADAGAVRVSAPQVDEDIHATRLELLDADGSVADSLETEPTRAGPWLDWEETLNSLYDTARLSGSGTAKVIEGLAEEWALPPDPDEIPF
jgi:hypothetical protein